MKRSAARNRENKDELVDVTVVIPTLNEMASIERCIASILEQEYPQDRIEIIVADGLSQDGSRECVSRLSDEHTNIRMLDNPSKTTPAALNIGIRAAEGDVVIILGAHTTMKKDFIRLNITYMNELNVKCVGGTQINVGKNFLQHAIGCVMSSSMGIPSAPYRYQKKERYVDTVVYAAYKRELFDEIGYFDEEMHISEDAELNWRIRKAGYKIFFTPEIVSYYYPRNNIQGLARQFYNYGILRVNVIKKHLDALRIMHIIPPLFVFLSMVLALLGMISRTFRPWLLGIWSCYLVYIISASVITSLKNREPKLLLILPLVYLIMQMSWGMGFIIGTIKTYK